MLAKLLILTCLVCFSSSWKMPEKDEWQTNLIYQIYPRSFKDSNSDGIGDLNGITGKISYLRDLGIDAIWLSPIFLSPMADFGYDITDYRAIQPEYGTMADFDNLLAECHKNGLKVLLDFVPNHTSNVSDWFLKSEMREPGFEDYYVWADGKPDPADPTKTLPPSNWVSIFRKSAWQYSEIRKQYFLHQFIIGQPDLNYRSPKVVEEMKNVLRFWLDKGVDGFRVDAVNVLFEVDPKDYGGVFPDEPLAGRLDLGPDDYEYYDHPYTKDMPEVLDIVYQWREVLEEYRKKDGEYRIMVTEAYTRLDLMMQYYGDGVRDGSMPFNFEYMGNLNNASTARDMKFFIDKWMTYMPTGATANWVNGNHDNTRLASKHGVARTDGMNMLALMLPDVAVTYQGEELAMTDGYVSWEDTVDPQACNTEDPINYAKHSRDPNRTPFQWDATAHAGFSDTTGKTWLPVADNYKTVNVDVQEQATKSHLKFYKELTELRKREVVRLGDLSVKVLADEVVALTRTLPGFKGIAALFNTGPNTLNVDLTAFRNLPLTMKVVASGVDSDYNKGATVRTEGIKMVGHSAVVLETDIPIPDISL